MLAAPKERIVVFGETAMAFLFDAGLTGWFLAIGAAPAGQCGRMIPDNKGGYLKRLRERTLYPTNPETYRSEAYPMQKPRRNTDAAIPSQTENRYAKHEETSRKE
jgi:hypothetical protein